MDNNDTITLTRRQLEQLLADDHRGKCFSDAKAATRALNKITDLDRETERKLSAVFLEMVY